MTEQSAKIDNFFAAGRRFTVYIVAKETTGEMEFTFPGCYLLQCESGKCLHGVTFLLTDHDNSLQINHFQWTDVFVVPGSVLSLFLKPDALPVLLRIRGIERQVVSITCTMQAVTVR